jgi:hypothetical protein
MSRFADIILFNARRTIVAVSCTHIDLASGVAYTNFHFRNLSCATIPWAYQNLAKHFAQQFREH